MTEKTYHITTFGCQMNERDSETLAGMLQTMGYTEDQDRQAADLVIFNTCSVRDNADKRFFGTLGQIKRLKLRSPGKIVAVCGCMMQQQHIVDRIKSDYSWVDLVFGTHNIHEFPDLIRNISSERSRLIDVWEDGGTIIEDLPVRRRHRHKAFVTITLGCDNFCTYCIVPYTRGRERSREPGAILREIRELVDDGVKEVTLLGQNVNSYGSGSGFGVDFPDLLRMIDAVAGLERIRFMTSHPKDLSDKLITVFSDCEKMARHIHLPVQSGSTAVLERMNRHYSKESYLALVTKLREAVPDIAITTDIIVGFPGESDKDFEDTMDLARQACFDAAFTFLYSIRKGTPAEHFESQVPEDIKHARFNRLVELLNEGAAINNSRYVGRIVDVLVEGPSKNDKRKMAGRTGTNKLVNFEAPSSVIGRIIPVEITEAKTFSLEGRLAGTGL